MRAQIAGDTEQAEKLATEALQIGTDSGQPDAIFIYGAQLGAVSFQRGTYGELAPRHRAGGRRRIPTSPASSSRRWHSPMSKQATSTTLAACWSRPLPPTSMFRSTGTGSALWPYYAEAAIACRDPKCSRTLFDRLAPWADQAPYPGLTVDSPVSHYLGGLATVLGRYDDADAYFARAAALNDRANAKFFAARNNLSWATMLAERNAPGDNERARDLLTKAHAAAAAQGYANIERRAAEALQRLD